MTDFDTIIIAALPTVLLLGIFSAFWLIARTGRETK